MIGDSISMQYGPYLQAYLHGKIHYARKTEADPAALHLDPPQGANGGDSSMVLVFVQAKAAANGFGADWLLLNCGLWDLRTDRDTRTKRVPLAQYKRNLETIVGLLLADGTAPIWVSSTPCDDTVHNARKRGFLRFAADVVAYNEAAATVMAAYGIPTIDLHAFTLGLGPDLYCDHVHFHDHVSQKQAAFIAGWLLAWDSAHRARRAG